MSNKKYYFAAALLAAAAGFLWWFDPSQTRIFPKCVFHTLTGLYCPGCGSTRAIHQLLHGSVSGALSMNPLLVVALPIIVLLYFRKKLAFQPWVAWGALIILLSYSILRNIHAWPFFYLAP
jgi:hypothetical protein